MFSHSVVTSSWGIQHKQRLHGLPTWSIVMTPLLPLQQGQCRCQIVSIKPPCSRRCVPIACLRSHRPTNPCWLHAHLPIHCKGNQFPRQPPGPHCLSVKTNSVLHFSSSYQKSNPHSYIHSWLYFHTCPCLLMIKPGAKVILTSQSRHLILAL